MTDLRTAAQQALEALENGKRVRAGEGGTKYQPPLEDSAITALRAALAQPEQGPVAWTPAFDYPNHEQHRVWENGEPRSQDVEYWAKNGYGITYAYTHPPRRETEQEPVARMHEDGSGRVISQRTHADAQREGGASWSSVKNYTTPLYTHPPRREPEQAVPVARVLQTVGQYHTGRFVAEVETVRRLRDGESLYTNPPRCEPEPPPEPVHPDKIRAEFLDIDRHTLPGDMTIEDWFTEGVRFAEKHNAQQ
jgi:hypothetical protein